MAITTVLTSNRAKIAEHLGVAEEAVDTASTKWVALLGEQELVGLVAGKALSPYERRTAVFVPKTLWRDKPTVAAIAAALDLLSMDVYKLTAAFPVNAEGALSLAMRLGFQREGINRRSWEGEDQYYLGKDGGKHNAAVA
jgi:hypothetical protein